MRPLIRLTGLVVLFSALIISCEPDNDSGIIIRDDLIGIWDVNETKGNAAPQFYVVRIKEGIGDDEILIEDLYNTLGTEVLAKVDGPNLNIPQQQTGGVSFNGFGLIQTDLSSISLEFTANDGTGDDQVEAILTP